MLRVKLLAAGAFATLGMVVWWLWSAGLNEPAMAMPVAPASGALPGMQQAGAAPGPATPASQAVPRDIFAGVHQPPGSRGDDPLKRYYRVSTEDLTKVQRALAGSSPAEALQAAQLLTRCANSDRDVQGLFEARDQQPWIFAKLGIGLGIDQMIENAQTLQRDCQVFDAAAHARAGALFEQAYVGGAAHSALSYLRWLQREGADAPPAALTAELQRQIRAEAEAADFGTLMALALTQDPQSLGLGAADKAGFERAWHRAQEADLGKEGAGKAWGPMLRVLKFFGETTPELTPAQEAQAEALAQRVFAAHERRKEALR